MNWLNTIVGVVAIVALIVHVYFRFFQERPAKVVSAPVPEPTAAPEPEPTTEKPVVVEQPEPVTVPDDKWFQDDWM